MSEHSSLEQFIQNVCNESHLRVEDDLGDGFVRLRSEEAERRQALQDIRCSEDILIEMLRNARDAGADRIYVATSKSAGVRSICVIDNGCGIPKHLHATIFEPRVTSKLDSMRMDTWGVHGRGMALYSIYHNANRACVLSSAPGLGASLLVETNTECLKEKTDQSTFPSFQLQEGTLKVLGPKNLMRTACEFALESRHSCQVRFGSATEIAAALFEDGLGRLSAEKRLFCSNDDDVPVCDRLSLSVEPDSFAETAAGIGLELSSRSARRIMNGEISAPSDLLTLISQQLSAQYVESEQEAQRQREVRRRKAAEMMRKGITLSEHDQQEFTQAIKQAYCSLAQAYYLDEGVQPEISCTKSGIRVFIPFKPID